MPASTSSQIVVYGDGACSGNPGPGGWAFLWIDFKAGTALERGGAADPTTNNRMELQAFIEALIELSHQPEREAEALFCWDSSYVVKGFNQWIYTWARNDFKKSDGNEVSNLDQWQAIWVFRQRFKHLRVMLVPGHSSIAGNERCDEIAVDFSKKIAPSLYFGPLDLYQHSKESLFPATVSQTPKTQKKTKKKTTTTTVKVTAQAQNLKGAPQNLSEIASQGSYPVYLSLLGGTLERHRNWEECQRRVHQTPALFKKVKNSNEEAQTLKRWGLA